ncbi:MAG: InlB B-repeat-containing protein [Erysipelotrichaceae bacterium]|nr:InlB B-repeat-containing protein [Erysipelotrichaceae bacterium]
MKKIIILVAFLFLLISNTRTNVLAENVELGYTEWSTEKTGDPNEISAIQYGRQLPKTWSEWSSEIPTSLYRRSREGRTNYYSYDGQQKFWYEANGKSLFTWDFKYPARIVFFYADVDTYINYSWTNYEGPPLQLYCDGNLIASVGRHDPMLNWNPQLDCNCRYLTLNMSSNNTDGRNTTSMVGTWATTLTTEYSYVTSWTDGQDWRFDTPYEHIIGENCQLPVEREVYSRPIKYQINYDLDGGKFVGEVKKEYTILEELTLPSASKKGYEFLGWFDENDKKYERIEKGSYGDLNLKAHYKRKPPILFVGYQYFDQKDDSIPIKDFIQMVNAKASDELDGDITNNIKVDYLLYEKDNNKILNPNELILNDAQSFVAQFSITNSGNVTVTVTRRFHILGTGEIKEVNDGVKIYSRYIDKDYLDTLKDNSIFKDGYYNEELMKAIEKAG